MAKIGIDARMYGKQVSGIGTYIKNLTEILFNLDKTNQYFLFLSEPNFSNFITTNNNIHKIKVNSPWYSYQEQTKFLATLNKYKLDLMHFPHFNAPILYKRPRIHTIHDITPLFFPGHKQKSWWRRYAYLKTIKTALKKSAKIITISNNTKSDLIRHFSIPETKIIVNYLGIEKQFHIIENYAKIKELKNKYKITKPFIFFVSAWRSHKNFEGLIKAFELLKNKYKQDLQLVLGGQADPYYPNIKNQIRKSPYASDILTPGFISDNELVLFYNAAKIYVNPSYYEGFGFTGLEAMACGIPVASSKLSSLPEAMGEAAIYFDPNDINNMTQQINRLLTDQVLQKYLIKKGFNQVKKFSWQNTGQTTLDIYKSILQLI